MNLNADQRQSTRAPSETPPAAKRQCVDATAAAMDFLIGPPSTVADNAAVDCDFDRYVTTPVNLESLGLTALSWWRDHERLSPQTARLAKKYLTIPASSVESERLFSACGRVISKLRSSLLPENAECIVFLNKNAKEFCL